MSDTVISVEGLSKRYLLGAQERASSFREAVSNTLTAPLRRLGRLASGGGTEEFWALKDVSFEVKRGEVVGVIGRNGAGKSTLLKVLSRITPPTSGRVRLRGRVASLLEVGTGFHPELTGRENIFLNGAILGMTTREIRRKFDEIVAFSEIEKFLDTPVKRYSSGMYVRLAFAVAAHLEPEILIVDEVLAVGDAAFQKKCLGKMKEVSQGGGRTVLFVSHNMAAVQSLCTECVVMRKGGVDFFGDTRNAIQNYLSVVGSGRGLTWTAGGGAAMDKPLSISEVRLTLVGQQPDIRLHAEVTAVSTASHEAAFVALDVHDPLGGWLMQSVPTLKPFVQSRRGRHTIILDVELPPLVPGTYAVSVWLGSSLSNTLDWAREVCQFEIHESPTEGRTQAHSADRGFIVPKSSLTYEAV